MAKIEVKTVPKGMITKVIGLVDGSEVIVLSNGEEGMWVIEMSTSLPSDYAEAEAMVECMRRVFLRAAEYGAPGTKQLGGS